jgi:hypothetical protein
MSKNLRFSENQNRKWEEFVLAAVGFSVVFLLYNQVVLRDAQCLAPLLQDEMQLLPCRRDSMSISFVWIRTPVLVDSG